MGADCFRKRWYDAVTAACALFNHSVDPKRVQAAYDTITKESAVDFGLLDEALQKKVIRHLVAHRKDTGLLIRMNPFLKAPIDVTARKQLIETNRRAILKNYGQDAYRRQLIATYRKVATTSVRQKIDKTVLVEAFLKLEQFSLLKWSDYRE